MANLPDSADGTRYQLTNLDHDIALIKNPGWNSEEILFRFDGRIIFNYQEADEKISSSSELTEEQKYKAFFWLGYFYSHLVRH